MHKKQIPNERRRQMMLKVMDGDMRIPPILFSWKDFARIDDVLEWCIRNRMTGKNLYTWLYGTFRNSILNPLHFIVAKIDKDPEYKPFIVGRDFLPGGRA